MELSGSHGRPVWLVDVDGCLDAGHPGGQERVGSVTVLGQEWERRWNQDVIDFVRRISVEGLAEVRWATTWVRWIDELERLWNLPGLPLAFPADSSAPTLMKLPAALAVVEVEGRPLVWTDDEAIPRDGAELARLSGSGQASLLLAPDSRRGLQDADLTRIEAFLLEHSKRPAGPSM